MTRDRRLAVLRDRPFRLFFLGYTTSLLGSAMASVALVFAILRGGGSGTELGWVMTARILPLVLMLLVGGVLGDRLGSRRTMLAADATRCLTQLGLVAALAGGRPRLGTLVALVAVWGVAEALFTPALPALVPHLVRPDALGDANTLLGMARSATTVAGPALSGLLTAAVNPSCVLALDAASYAVSTVVLLFLPVAAAPPAAGAAAPSSASSFVSELRAGWTEFRSRTWLWVTTAQFCLFNLLVRAPYLVLGPVIAEQRLGGSTGWGLALALDGGGAVAAGLAMLGRRPRRPLLLATVATCGWALPSAALATGRPLSWLCAAELLAGAGSAVSGTLYATTTQQRVPTGMLARVNAYTVFGAFVLGPIGLAAAGPAAAVLGASHLLAFGAAWQLAAAAVVLALPSIRRALPAGPAPDPSPARDAHTPPLPGLPDDTPATPSTPSAPQP